MNVVLSGVRVQMREVLEVPEDLQAAAAPNRARAPRAPAARINVLRDTSALQDILNVRIAHAQFTGSTKLFFGPVGVPFAVVEYSNVV